MASSRSLRFGVHSLKHLALVLMTAVASATSTAIAAPAPTKFSMNPAVLPPLGVEASPAATGIGKTTISATKVKGQRRLVGTSITLTAAAEGRLRVFWRTMYTCGSELSENPDGSLNLPKIRYRFGKAVVTPRLEAGQSRTVTAWAFTTPGKWCGGGKEWPESYDAGGDWMKVSLDSQLVVKNLDAVDTVSTSSWHSRMPCPASNPACT